MVPCLRSRLAPPRVDTKDLQPVSSAPSTAPSPPVPGCQGGQNGLSRPGGAQAGLGGSGAQQTAIQKGSPHHQLSRASHIEESEHFKKGSNPREDIMIAFSFNPLTKSCHSFPEKKWNSISDIVVPNISRICPDSE